jgi:hypothetical protein
MVDQRLSPVRLLPTYAAVVGVPALALFVILRVGETITARGPALGPGPVGAPPSAVVPTTAPIGATGSAVPDLPLLLVQIIVILLAARIAGALVRRLGQPQVVGEMLAGIALGPSLLGAHAPALAAALFPPQSLGFLNALAQIGRGLMELVILNVRLDVGVISRELFAMMVLMALATTFMTTPLVGWLLPSPGPERADSRAAAPVAR